MTDIKKPSTRAKKDTDAVEVKPKKQRVTKAKVVKLEKLDGSQLSKDASVEELVDDVKHLQDEAFDEVKPIVPLFVGCADFTMIKKISDYLATAEDTPEQSQNNYEIVVMGKEVLAKSIETFMFQRMDVLEQQDILKRQRNENVRVQFTSQAIDLREMMLNYLDIKTTEGSISMVFTPSNLRNAFLTERGKDLSNKELRDVIDALSIYNLISPTLVDVPYIKQQYQFTINTEAQLLNTDKLIIDIDKTIAEAQYKRQMLETNKTLLANQLINEQSTQNQDGNNNRPLSTGSGELPEVDTIRRDLEAQPKSIS